MPGELNSPYRFDPFDQSVDDGFRARWNEGDEEHVAETHESNGRVGFFLFEAPQSRTPSTFACESLATGGGVLREVPRLTVPSADQYRVDYDADGFTGTGFVEVHESRLGETFVVGYHGLGTPPRWTTRLMASLNVDFDAAIAGDLEVGTDLDVTGASNLHGDVALGVDTGSTITASGHPVEDVGNAVASTDGLPLGQAEDLVESFVGLHGVTVLSGSGNWSKPDGVRYVMFVAIGPGGNGAVENSGGGGGGGGAAVYGIADLDSIGGSTFAYVVGTAGTDSSIFGCTAAKGAAASTTSGGAGGTGTVGANVVGRAVTGGTGANGSGGGTGGGGGGAAGGFGTVGTAGGSPTGGAGGGLFSGTGGTGTTGSGNAGAVYGAGGGGGASGGSIGGGAAGLIFLIY